jgi:transcriptional regulator with XRE-family HTH domain
VATPGKHLSEKQRQRLLRLLRFDPQLTLAEIGRRFGISASAVRKIREADQRRRAIDLLSEILRDHDLGCAPLTSIGVRERVVTLLAEASHG